MINVEGDYDEIVAWMDDNPVTGIDHYQRGIPVGYDDDGDIILSHVGLFSVTDLVGWKGAWEMDYMELEPRIRGIKFPVEDPENTHLIRF